MMRTKLPSTISVRLRATQWPPVGAVVACLVLYLVLPKDFTVGPDWAFMVVELAMVVVLLAATWTDRWSAPVSRRIVIGLIALLSLANAGSLILLIHSLLFHKHFTGAELVKSGADIWLTNMIVFALWYWELDQGGPTVRGGAAALTPDFLFPQMATPQFAPAGWSPGFVDYLYISFTTSTSFAPNDTVPLTRWAKVPMAFQSTISLITIGLVVARAVNVLG
jgi:hypothetical protein